MGDIAAFYQEALDAGTPAEYARFVRTIPQHDTNDV